MAVRGFGRWLLGGVIWCAMSMPAGAATVTLAWDPNPEPDVNNYNVYVRTAGGSFGAPIPVGNRTNWTLSVSRATSNTILRSRPRVRQD